MKHIFYFEEEQCGERRSEKHKNWILPSMLFQKKGKRNSRKCMTWMWVKENLMENYIPMCILRYWEKGILSSKVIIKRNQHILSSSLLIPILFIFQKFFPVASTCLSCKGESSGELKEVLHKLSEEREKERKDIERSVSQV